MPLPNFLLLLRIDILSHKTLANNILIIARILIIYKSLSRDTVVFHVYKTHDRIAISIGGINTTR